MRSFYSIFAFVTALLVLLLPSCKTTKTSYADEPISYLALGDSYTISHGVEELLRWPNQLSDRLIENNFVVTKTDIIAKTGWKTSDLLRAMEGKNLDSYNLVSLLIGVNNQYRSQPFDLFESEFNLLLSKSIMIAGGNKRVFVVSIPDYGVTPFGANDREGIARDINKYNDYIKNRCKDQDVRFIDITDISRQLGDGPGALVSDNLHPSGSQYTKWVERALPVVTDILSRN